MEGSSKIGPASTGSGRWSTTDRSGSTSETARPGGGPQPSGSQGPPGLPNRASRDAAHGPAEATELSASALRSQTLLAPRVSLGVAVPMAPVAHVAGPGGNRTSNSLLSLWGIGSIFGGGSPLPQLRSAATIDVEKLNDSALDGRLARSALQLALDRPGQTIELDLSLRHRTPTSMNPADTQPDRTLRLRFLHGSGTTLSTSAPAAGEVSLRIREQSVLGKEADAVAGLLDRVSSLSRFSVMGARINPPPVVTGLSGPGSASSLPKPEQSLIGLARWPDPAHNKEHDRDHQAYGRSFLEATRDAGTQLSQGGIRSLRELWTYAQDWRGSKASSNDRRDFGVGSQRRDVGVASPDMTSLIGPYTYIRDRYKDRYKNRRKDPSDGFLEPPEHVSWRYAVNDSIDGKPIVLSSVSIRTEWDEASAKDYLASLHDENWRGEGPPPFRINHTSLANSQRIMDHAESLFSRALDPSISRSEALTTLGELHWWLSHAMPDIRGSAAKTELGVRALAQARGMDLPPFKHGFVPDLEALTRPREDFVKHYASSFSRPPDL